MNGRPRAFFLFGDGGLRVEPDIVGAAGYMEPVDVDNGEYDAVFDDTGRRYRFRAVGGMTHLEPTDETDLAALRERLRTLASGGAYRFLEGFDAEDPLRAAAAISRWEWEHRWPRWPSWLSRRLHGDEPRIAP
jgi:hypothetical protein